MDKIERTILLQTLQQKLMYVGFDKLGLRHLNALRNEVNFELEKVIEEGKCQTK